MDYNYNLLGPYLVQHIIRVEFEVGHLSNNEEDSLHAEIEKALLGVTHSDHKKFKAEWKFDAPTFGILYDEETDTEKVDKLLFKLKLQFPGFKILENGKQRLSIRS